MLLYDGKNKMQINIIYEVDMSINIDKIVFTSIDMHIQNYGENGCLLKSNDPNFKIINFEDNIIKFTFNVDKNKMDKLFNSSIEDKLLLYTLSCNLKLKKFRRNVDFKKRDCLKVSSENTDKIIYKISI